MRAFPTQVGPGGEPVSDTTSWTSSNANDALQEAQNAITDSGQTLIPVGNPADNTQSSEAMSRNAAVATFYADSGVADAYVLSTLGSFKSPSVYLDGQIIRWIADNPNTGASTVNAGAVGVVSLTAQGGAALSGTEIDTTNENQARFDLSNNRFELVRAGGIVVGTTNVMGKTILRVSTTDTAVAGNVVIADTTGGAFTVNLPASPSADDYVRFDVGADYGTNNLTIGRNGQTIVGDAADLVVSTNNPFALRFSGTDWRIA